MDMNILLSQNNYLRSWITFPTGRFYKGNWLVYYQNLVAIMKFPKN